MEPDPTQTSARRWWLLAVYGVLFCLAGLGLAIWDAHMESGDVNDIFDPIGMLMAASGLLVVVTGWRAAVRGPSGWLLAAVFFLHAGPVATFGIYAVIFYLVT